jgi:hypothetical protein
MGYDDKVKEQVAGSKGLIERITLHIPFYSGYRKRNTARDVDREVRYGIIRIMKGVKIDLEGIHREVVLAGDMDLARNVERIRTKTDTHCTRIEKAANGYSGIFATMKVKDEELDAVVEWDAKILDGAADLRELSENIRNAAEDGEDIKKMLRNLENIIDDLMEQYNERDKVLKGLADGE